MEKSVSQIFNQYLYSIDHDGAGIKGVMSDLDVDYLEGRFNEPSFFNNYFIEGLISDLSSLEHTEAIWYCQDYISRIIILIEKIEDHALTYSDLHYHHTNNEQRAIIITLLDEKQVRDELTVAHNFFKGFLETRPISPEEPDSSMQAVSQIQFNLTTERLAALFLVMWETSLIDKPTKKVIEDKGKSEFSRKAVLLFKTLNDRDIGYNYFYDSFSGKKASALGDIEKLLERMRMTAIRLMQDKDNDS